MTATVENAPAIGTRTTWKLDPIYTDEKNPRNSSVEVTLNAASLDTRTDQRDQHLRSADFLDVEKFPEIKFRSTRIEGDKDNFKLTGDLTIRDVTRPITLDVEFEGSTRDPWGGERVGFSGKGKLDRREFGLTWNQALETGGVVVGNDIKISLEVEAIKAE